MEPLVRLVEQQLRLAGLPAGLGPRCCSAQLKPPHLVGGRAGCKEEGRGRPNWPLQVAAWGNNTDPSRQHEATLRCTASTVVRSISCSAQHLTLSGRCVSLVRVVNKMVLLSFRKMKSLAQDLPGEGWGTQVGALRPTLVDNGTAGCWGCRPIHACAG